MTEIIPLKSRYSITKEHFLNYADNFFEFGIKEREYLGFIECEFRLNSTPNASSRGEGCPLLIYSDLTLFLADVGLDFFSIQTSRSDIAVENEI